MAPRAARAPVRIARLWPAFAAVAQHPQHGDLGGQSRERLACAVGAGVVDEQDLASLAVEGGGDLPRQGWSGGDFVQHRDDDGNLRDRGRRGGAMRLLKLIRRRPRASGSDQ